jgi:ribosome-associated toxin RatA of RatAB toxin-antitoxin module
MKTPVWIIAAFLLATLQTEAQAGKDKVRDRLSGGEIVTTTKKVPGSGMPKATAMMVVDAPPQAIWAIISRCGNYKQTMERVKTSREISRKGNKVRCELVIDMPSPLDDLRSVTDAIHTVVPGEKWVRSWKLVEGDYTSNTGSWTLAPFNEKRTRTLVIYKVHAVPNTAIPDMLKRLAQKKALPGALEHLRSHFRTK